MSTSSPLKLLAVIPARFASTRFPGKPLALIDGKPMIQHVWERVTACRMIDRVIVATEDDRIRDTVTQLGGEVWLTSPDHVSGSDRIWEVASQLPEYNWVLNVQGDEPFFPSENLNHLTRLVAQQQALEATLADVYTLVSPFREQSPTAKDVLDPNQVKALLEIPTGWRFPEVGDALLAAPARYFSRSVIPHARNWPNPVLPEGQPLWFRHMGVYLYQRAALQAFTTLAPHPVEMSESLEQLRFLFNGFTLHSGIVEKESWGIDTPGDLVAVEQLRRELQHA